MSGCKRLAEQRNIALFEVLWWLLNQWIGRILINHIGETP
jgi:hypothetical protein